MHIDGLTNIIYIFSDLALKIFSLWGIINKVGFYWTEDVYSEMHQSGLEKNTENTKSLRKCTCFGGVDDSYYFI